MYEIEAKRPSFLPYKPGLAKINQRGDRPGQRGRRAGGRVVVMFVM